MAQDSVKSLMNSRVISVLSETSVITAIDIILSNNYNGIPVVDKSGVIIGIVTKYDIISKRGSLRDDSKVVDVMNNDPLTLSEDMTVEDAIQAFAEHHRVDPIPVVDMEKKVIGVISRYDMVKLFKEYGLAFTSGGKEAELSVAVKKNYSYIWFLAVLAGLVGAVYYFFF